MGTIWKSVNGRRLHLRSLLGRNESRTFYICNGLNSHVSLIHRPEGYSDRCKTWNSENWIRLLYLCFPYSTMVSSQRSNSDPSGTSRRDGHLSNCSLAHPGLGLHAWGCPIDFQPQCSWILLFLPIHSDLYPASCHAEDSSVSWRCDQPERFNIKECVMSKDCHLRHGSLISSWSFDTQSFH